MQDGRRDRERRSVARILRYNLANGHLDAQYVYITDPIAERPYPDHRNGLVELLPFNNQFMLNGAVVLGRRAGDGGIRSSSIRLVVWGQTT